MEIIREPAVAGMFYPAAPNVLKDMIKQDLAQAKPVSVTSVPRVLIVPHAGYIYSAPIAASAYALLLPFCHLINRVILIGPSHRTAFTGVAISHYAGFKTPLGVIPVARQAQAKISEINGVQLIDEAHIAEHSLEVQLPFLQTLLDDFSIVPIVAGDASPNLIKTIIESFWDNPENLIIISSDLSHYHQYRTAQKLDQATTQAILDLNLDVIDSEHACGCVGIRGLLAFCQDHGLQATVLDVRNSGDTAGSKDSVVGYGAYAFTKSS